MRKKKVVGSILSCNGWKQGKGECIKQESTHQGRIGNLRGSDQLSNQSKKTVQKAARYYIKKLKEKGADFKGRLMDSLQKAKEEIDEEVLTKVSITDPDSRFMKTQDGDIDLFYSPRVTVDRTGFILANDVSQNA